MNSKRFEKIGKALADPHRLKILQEFKTTGDFLPCSRIHEILDMTQPSISHHVKQLVDANILESIKEGRNIKYALNTAVLDEFADYIKSLKP
ncbi:ArsR/SmtB family transcription factor [Chitinophaga sp. 30R24]|uniref:ArsR/SmtB family transcription factor n=1 Tax=Chitinophaga sp. 30R24 TaxID=3248838 RepID=UPI003B8F3F7C